MLGERNYMCTLDSDFIIDKRHVEQMRLCGFAFENDYELLKRKTDFPKNCGDLKEEEEV